MFKLFFPVEQVIRDNRNWLFMAVGIFMIFTLVFFFSTVPSDPEIEAMLDSQLAQLQEMVTFILEKNPVISALLVFMNNYISMAQMLIFGAVAGISPLVTLGLNGAIVGMLLALSAGNDPLLLLQIIVFGILPHGIFELFAFFLCAAIGLKFGYHCIASPLSGKTRLESFRFIWKEAISVLPLVVLLLLLAAFIEIMITPRLLELVF